MMIETSEEAEAILAEDPEVNPAVFWPRVGITKEAIYGVGRKTADVYNIPFSVAMATLEMGALLVERGLKEE
jgi:hypothetical protein